MIDRVYFGTALATPAVISDTRVRAITPLATPGPEVVAVTTTPGQTAI